MTRYEIPYPETIKNPDGVLVPFDPSGNSSHRNVLRRVIDKWRTRHPEAQDAELDVIDADRRVAILKDKGVASVSRNDDDSFRVNLTPDQCKPSKGLEVATRYEPMYPGYRMTEFHPYAGQMLMERMDDDLATARGQIAEYLKINPWDVKVSRTGENGLRLVFQKPFTYQEERDGGNLQRAAAAVGHEGWWAEVDAKEGTAIIHPGEPATFPKTVPFPFDRLGESATRDRMPFAVQPARPEETAEPLLIDWTQSPGLLVAGLSGGGKAQPLDAPIPVPVSEHHPDGWATMGDLTVGEPVFTPDGGTAPIVSFSDVVERDVWEVELSDGQIVECAGDHLWTVCDEHTGEMVTGATEWLARRDGWAIPIQAAVTGSRTIRNVDPFAEGVRLTRGDMTRIPVEFRRMMPAWRLRMLDGILAGTSDRTLTLPDATAADVAELARSLGFITMLRTIGGGWSRVTVASEPGGRLRITAIRHTVRCKPMRCIRLASRPHLYLCSGFVPTHNSVTINDLAAFSVAAGSEIYVLDHATKATDFYWLRPWVAPHGWGADGLLQTCGLLKWLLDDIEDNGARARAWREHGWQNWYDDLSDEDKLKYPLRTIIVDELSQLAVGGKNATSIPKNPLPAVMERMIEQQIIALNQATLIKLTQVGRAYGYRFIVATQIASSTTGMPPALRGNLGHKLIMGARASDAQKGLVFNDARSVPDVPANVINEGVSKGAGMSEFEGRPPCVFKSAFPLLGSHAGTTALGEALADRVGLPDGFTREEYLDSLDKSTPSNPDYERRIMNRIRFRAQDTYRLYPFLGAMRDKLEEVEAEYGGGAVPLPSDDGDANPDPVVPLSQAAPVPVADDAEPSGLMDARLLARLMEGRG